MAEVKTADLKVVIKEINSLKIKGVSTIRTVGISRVNMEKTFLAAVNTASDKGMEEKLSDDCVNIYNDIMEVKEAKEAEGGDAGEKKKPTAEKKATDKKPVEKKADAAAKKKADAAAKKKADASAKKKASDKKPVEKKEPAERSCYDHVPGKQTGILDESLREGGTVAEIMEAAGVKRPRVMAHIKYLRDTCGLTIVFKENKKGDKLLDHYKVKEEIYRKP